MITFLSTIKFPQSYLFVGSFGEIFDTIPNKGVVKMNYSQIIANRILSLSRARKISINKLAGMCNLNQSTLDNIIHGASQNPRIVTLHKIAYAFGMTISEFLDFPEIDAVTFEENSTRD